MGFKNEYKKALKYSMAVGGAMIAGPAGAKAGYDLGSTFDPRNKNNKSGTDLGKLRADAVANGFNPLTVLRATGGQGYYKNQVPMGRLSSDAFFNAFDAYERKQNKNTSVSDTTMDGMMYGAQVAQTTSPNTNAQPKLAFNNSPLYPVRETEIENDYISTGTEFVANKTTALLRPMKLPDGRVIMVPFDPEDMDPMTILSGYGALALSNFTHMFPEIRPIKAFKEFGKSIRKKGEITRTKLPKQKDPMRYEQARKYGILSWITDTEKQF
jgi:hypothetical protein